ncbi:MAG: DUF192 domain-containing protein [Pseudomonadota bacterium]
MDTLFPVEIKTRTASHVLEVELALTKEQQERGLMHRKTLADRSGMLFQFEQVAPARIWMKNTYVSLDLIFISDGGQIVSIVHSARPDCEQMHWSDGYVRALLEVSAGLAKTLGIQPGDSVTYDKHLFPTA